MSATASASPSQLAAPRGPGSHRRGRPRRGYRNGPPGRVTGSANPSESVQAAQPDLAGSHQGAGNAVPGEAANSFVSRGRQNGLPRGDFGGDRGRGRGGDWAGGRRGGGGGAGPRRGRGGAPRSSLVVGSQRQFGGHLTSAQGESTGTSTGLNAEAVEFVPGQPTVPRRFAYHEMHSSSSYAYTENSALSHAASAPPQRVVKPALKQAPKSSAADLPTRIQEDIDNGHYECVICTSEVLRSSRVWSCSICWTVAHLHCVKKWHTNQVKSPDQNPEPQQMPTWRCPGCNSSLTEAPGPYHCWCGKDINPQPIPGLPAHSCGQTCSKPRARCPHPCSLMCHAGPCPACVLMGPSQTCFCGKNTSTRRCSETDYGKGWSCQEVCGDLLPCGEHTCSRPCHSGLCGGCEIPTLSTCYCGREQKEISCDRRDEVHDSFNYGQLVSQDEDATDGTRAPPAAWFEGSFRCGKACGRPYDCGHHTCEKSCHAQDEEAAHCPFSPDVVTHCPCGKTSLQSMTAKPRQSCRDPIPRCDKACNRALSCGHLCLDKCHTGPCAPCTQTVDITCRCGRTTVRSACHQGQVEHPVCFRICRAQLNCGRHECGEHCCPGERKAAERRKQKQRSVHENFEAEHICLQICGRPLKCGKHTCQQLCHKGPCASCPEAIFDEISCSCGRTVLQPPQPCGTRPPECRFECTKPRPCGHPRVSHQCHPEDTACPKCPFLVEKACICGKKSLKNQPCWFDEVRCGLPCGKTLKCGTHKCTKTCHRPGQCEDSSIVGSHCSQPCGKVRKSCEHTCADQCHAPYPCKEDKPCQSKTFVTCPCQNRKIEVKCQATRHSPSPARDELKCDDECLRLQRNRRLAEALNIDPETHVDDHVSYSDTTLKLFRENVNWAQAQERELRVFAADPDEKRLRFKPMPANQRAFLHALAEDYGLDSESQDPEPHRHVSVFKTPRFVSAPRKTLAQCLRIVKTAASLGAAVSSTANGTKSGSTTTTAGGPPPFNALLLTEPRFGLTVDELDTALAPDLRARSGPAVTFVTSFLPSDEVLIKAHPAALTAASAAVLGPTTPQAVEAVVEALKPIVARTVARLKLAGAVTLCHADESLRAVRREGDAASGAGGWNAVVGRGGWRRLGGAGMGSGAGAGTTAPESKPRSGFLVLRKTVEPKKKTDVEEVEDDWFTAAEKMQEEEEEKGETEEAEDGEERRATADALAGSTVGNGEGLTELESESQGTEGDDRALDGDAGDAVAVEVAA